MGTETTAMTTWQNALPTLWVKLNNPLMGTETHFLNFCFYELKY